MIEDKNRADPNGSVVYVSKGKERIARPNVSDEPLPTLPLAPTLVPVLGFKGNASATSMPARSMQGQRWSGQP